MEIVFATNNVHKIKEISNLLDSNYQILSLQDINILEEIPEKENSLEGNALAKASYIFSRTGLNVFADDTGLEVDCLDGRPGVLSARYAGPENSAEKNMAKLLTEMKSATDRNARFRTVIALILDGKEYLFEGIVEGTILHERQGKGGFGYDPLFVAKGMEKTFAEIMVEEKNRISHRALATRKLINFLGNSGRQ